MTRLDPYAPVPPEIAAKVREYLRRPYHKHVYRDPDGYYLAEVVELPGCMSDGDTEAEALANLTDAMTGWLESVLLAGQPVPEPLNETTYSGKYALRMPKSLHQRLAKQAEREGVSLNQWLVTLLAQGSGAAG